MPFTMNIAGQVGQIRLARSKALWPLFETVVNSIQSLEDVEEGEDKTVVIDAIRADHPQIRIDSQGNAADELTHFEEFVVTDNGVGFNEENYTSFLEAYSQLKIRKGCKGIGRFLWLKAFDSVSISSMFYEGEAWRQRCFEFTLNGVRPEDNLADMLGDQRARKTVVALKGFKGAYRDSVALSLDSLARKIIEHCLPYFIMGDCPTIELRDSLGEAIVLNDYFDSAYRDTLHQDEMVVKGEKYTLYHMLLAKGADRHELHLCANNREVKSVDLARLIPNMQRRLEVDGGGCYYVGYLASSYLDKSINAARSEFDFLDLPIAGDSSPASESEIIDAAVRFVKSYLHDDLSRIDEEKRVQIDRLVQSEKPQYRLLLNRRPDVYDEIPTGLSDDRLDLELYKHQQKWELDVAKRGQDIKTRVKASAATDPSFDALFEEYCQSITDLSRASLAEYVAKRKTVIDLLEEALALDAEGKYSKESRIHSIICPMQATSDDVAFDDMNLWLIDDRLAYHRFLASDKEINSIPVVDSDSSRRMDIAVFDAALSYASDPESISSITIVELKRPQRDDLDKDDTNPVQQVLDYVDAIKRGEVKKENGRGFGNVQNVAFYCYVVADMTETLQRSARGAGLILTQDGEGYFGYNSSYGAYIEVISYDKLLKNAKQRNRVLFDKLFVPKVVDLAHPELV